MKWLRPTEVGKFSNKLTVCRADGLIQQYETRTRKVIHTISELKDAECSLRSMDYNSDNSYFMVGGSDSNVYLYDNET
jgi:WD40 repeat protein